jgi:hypothetical protein
LGSVLPCIQPNTRRWAFCGRWPTHIGSIRDLCCRLVRRKIISAACTRQPLPLSTCIIVVRLLYNCTLYFFPPFIAGHVFGHGFLRMRFSFSTVAHVRAPISLTLRHLYSHFKQIKCRGCLVPRLPRFPTLRVSPPFRMKLVRSLRPPTNICGKRSYFLKGWMFPPMRVETPAFDDAVVGSRIFVASLSVPWYCQHDFWATVLGMRENIASSRC